MATPSTISPHTRESYTNVVHEADVDGGWSGQLRVVRATGINGIEMVFVDSNLLGPRRLVLTPQEAADFAEAVHNASNLVTSTHGAQFLAQVHRESLARRGVSPTRAATVTGIARHRLRKLLAGEVPMTNDEHKALSEVDG